ncbi:FHA domain-containing protein [Anaerosoma tenue]|uniref:FHA domain-containing protein n=1 Tax=Anaerosoma tenue TaxID=2933588 RepID=UPI002260FCD5|nr:FHA domain-containing protein [Anaerosoma tenue]MCK8115273.1 FHA domain-containing protein [Anaerosoma tenue]
MVDIVLLFGRIVLIGLLYLFLLAAIRSGIGKVRGGVRRPASGLALRVTRGPREITGVTVPLSGPVLIGRSADADLVIADDFVSSTHARVVVSDNGFIIEDLDSTNGTVVNGQPVTRPMPLSAGDAIELGRNRIEVVRL